jgi:phosphoenolpyruvate synthase/pyruvate phosphate dikinase
VSAPGPGRGLAKALPGAYKEFLKIRRILEQHFKDVQDFEFTIQEGKLYMLQTRNGKRTAAAALKFAADMVKEKLIDWKTAVLRNPADQLDQLLAPVFDAAEVKKAKASPAACPPARASRLGKDLLNADRAEAAAHKGQKVMLVRVETSPEDLRGMIAAEGILTARGGVLARRLVARQMGKVCICGAGRRHRLRASDRQGRRPDLQGRRLDLLDGTSGTSTGQDRDRALRDHHRSHPGQEGLAADPEVQVRPAHGVVRRWRSWASAPTPTPRSRSDRRRLRRRGHRPDPHRAHVLRG